MSLRALVLIRTYHESRPVPAAAYDRDDLVGDIVYRSELWAEERELVEHEGWKEHESRVLDLGLLLNCFERR